MSDKFLSAIVMLEINFICHKVCLRNLQLKELSARKRQQSKEKVLMALSIELLI